jgi:hypothetical protein
MGIDRSFVALEQEETSISLFDGCLVLSWLAGDLKAPRLGAQTHSNAALFAVELN